MLRSFGVYNKDKALKKPLQAQDALCSAGGYCIERIRIDTLKKITRNKKSADM